MALLTADRPFCEQFYGTHKESTAMKAIFFVFSCLLPCGAAPTLIHPYPLSVTLPWLLCHHQLSPLSGAAGVVFLTLIMSRGEGSSIAPKPLLFLPSPFLVAPVCDPQRSLHPPPPPFSALVAGWLLSVGFSCGQGSSWASSFAVGIFVGVIVLQAELKTARQQQQHCNTKTLVLPVLQQPLRRGVVITVQAT